MKIEFKKAPQTPKELEVEFNSVKIVGTFCKISQSLVKIDAKLIGNTDIDCCRCGITDNIELDEKLDFLLSDRIIKNDESEDLVIEIENGLIDFDEIIQGELEAIKSDYHICEQCSQNNDDFEKEF
ncbi:hypothetical protein [Poseidonibacter ostreae]|jgi:uncharacterized metal-binding protein YceD (DUF177 family)|uniref:DUF177 domain-containing protein n=1 Tax=Poseidonibacter ostreae TaxID=2654171 RepID=A0A6L4WRP1_9BACT|nr:hypothetical protein [Poseidonibacter ostreae]KAB7887523.1 hypothetical protein GA417_02455 [Poseidonibacter ostreae]KAB7888418.1 hypothetical protein GBG19_09275 [Poseidonibacter ostreae]KAB7889125.1 hypothetical protein GBG18_11695 [Poseidonibacter ostreae]|tara:strand:- start:257 stop:634 length:378 start_codon:yes stop_codon:yes gene_type:complete